MCMRIMEEQGAGYLDYIVYCIATCPYSVTGARWTQSATAGRLSYGGWLAQSSGWTGSANMPGRLLFTSRTG